MQVQGAGGRRTALVTGGAAGVGRAVAVELARRGWRVLIAGRSPARGAEVLTALQDAGPNAGHGPRRRPRRVPARAQRPDRRAALWVASEVLTRPWLPELGQPYPPLSRHGEPAAAAKDNS